MNEDRPHLSALCVRLSHELARIAAAGSQAEKELRLVWAKQIELEIADERKRLGLPPEKPISDLTDDELWELLT